MIATVKIKTPDLLSQKIHEGNRHLDREIAKSAQARAAADSRIAALETSAAECDRNIELLKTEAINSNEAAGQLVIAERHALSLSLELSNLKTTRQQTPGIDIIPALIVLQ